MSIPTRGELYSKMMERLRLIQEDTAMMAHLYNADGHNEYAKMWLRVSENFKKAQYSITQLAKRGLQ